jgi:alkylhydroperoxidase/carboxymuconolactone decarboxylase family protein YurZ
MDRSERLRRLALNQLTADLSAPDGPGDWLEPSLDAKTLALVRLSALVAMGGGVVPSYAALADEALSSGASAEEVVDILLGILPVVGPVRIVTAAPQLALALGYDADDPSDSWPPRS